MSAPYRDAPPSRGTWLYDGSLEGLFSLAHRAYAEGTVPEAVANALASEGELFSLLGPEPLRASARGLPDAEQPPAVIGEPAAAAETASVELRSFSSELFDAIVHVWMSEQPVELELFRVCAAAGLRGPDVLYDHSAADLRAVLGATRRVRREIERMKGLARFSPRGDGLFCAPLEPDANIAAALLPHFARRFGPEDFALVDVRRRLAFARRGGRFESATGSEALSYLPDDAASDEDLALWRRYFKATENPSRKNPELQRRLMPRRYWRFLPEIAGLS